MKSLSDDSNANGLWKTVCKYIMTPSYITPLLITLFLSYGFFLTHFAISIDDLSNDRYLFGELFAQGRFASTILMHLLRFSDPVSYRWTLDLVGVMLYGLSAVFFSALFDLVSKSKLKTISNTIFSCLYVSYPLCSELFGYLGTTLSIGSAMIMTACSCYLVYKAINDNLKILIVPASLLLLVITSLYESVISVYVCLVFAILLLQYQQNRNRFPHLYAVIKEGLLYAVPLVVGMILELFISKSLIILLDLIPSNHAETEIMYGTFGIFKSLRMLFFRFCREYFAMSLWYLPIATFSLFFLVFLILGIVDCIKNKSLLPLVFYAGVILSLLSMSLILGYCAPYRIGQVFAFFVGFSGFLLSKRIIAGKRGRKTRFVVFGFIFLLVFYQASDLSHWFELDYHRYEEERDVVKQVGYTLSSQFDISKPVVFVGEYQLSNYIQNKIMVHTADPKVAFLNTIYPLYTLDYDNQYYRKIQQTNVSTYITWGEHAFGEVNTELLKFFSYCGFDFKQGTREMHDQAVEKSKTLPSWPNKGSIVDEGSFILVNWGTQ